MDKDTQPLAGPETMPEKSPTGPREIVENYLSTPDLPFVFEKNDPEMVLNRIVWVREKIRSMLRPRTVGKNVSEEGDSGRSLDGPFTGRGVEIKAGRIKGSLRIGQRIGVGAEGWVYDVDSPAEQKVDFPLVVKIIKPDAPTRKEYLPGSLDNPFTTTAAHVEDVPPVLPRYVAMTEIDGNPAMVMEKVSDVRLTEIVKIKPLQERHAVEAILPLVKFLKTEEGRRRTLRDYKVSDIPVAVIGEGSAAHPYFRLIEFGVSQIRETDEKQDKQSGIENAAKILLYSLIGNEVGLQDLTQTNERNAQEALNDLSKNHNFQELTPALKYVLLKAIDKTEDRYNTFGELEQDLMLINVIPFFADGEDQESLSKTLQILSERGSSQIVGQALRLNLYEASKLKAKVANEVTQDAKAVGSKITEACALPTPETPEEKEKRLKFTREHIAYILNLTVSNGHAGQMGVWGGTIDKYLKEKPDDQEVRIWGGLSQALDLVSATLLSSDDLFKKSYLSVCQSLQEGDDGKKQLISAQELESKAKPIFQLQQMILGVINSQKT